MIQIFGKPVYATNDAATAFQWHKRDFRVSIFLEEGRWQGRLYHQHRLHSMAEHDTPEALALILESRAVSVDVTIDEEMNDDE